MTADLPISDHTCWNHACDESTLHGGGHTSRRVFNTCALFRNFILEARLLQAELLWLDITPRSLIKAIRDDFALQLRLLDGRGLDLFLGAICLRVNRTSRHSRRAHVGWTANQGLSLFTLFDHCRLDRPIQLLWVVSRLPNKFIHKALGLYVAVCLLAGVPHDVRCMGMESPGVRFVVLGRTSIGIVNCRLITLVTFVQ